MADPCDDEQSEMREASLGDGFGRVAVSRRCATVEGHADAKVENVYWGWRRRRYWRHRYWRHRYWRRRRWGYRRWGYYRPWRRRYWGWGWRRRYWW